MPGTEINRHTNPTIERLSENRQSRSFFKINLMDAKLRVPQVGTLASAHSHSHQKTPDIALSLDQLTISYQKMFSVDVDVNSIYINVPLRETVTH